MEYNKISILNVDICSIYLHDLLKNLKTGVLVTPNVDHLVRLKKDQEFLACYKAADWVICDSKIVNLAAKFLNTPFKEVIPGSSFFPAFYEYHRFNDNIKIFLLGAGKGVANKAMDNINNKMGRKMVVGAHSPSYGFENDANECESILKIIQNSGANVLVVGVGAPKQEKWIMRNKDELYNINLFLALGATIDFEAGHIQRAPLIYQKLHMEWLYRMLKDPKRLWKRYLIDDVPFFWDILKQKFGLL
jgi:exopolysaccharide biosynthesis WecB/TagA/CpsF family protein